MKMTINIVVKSEDKIKRFQENWLTSIKQLLQCNLLYEVNLVGFEGIQEHFEVPGVKVYTLDDMEYNSVVKKCLEISETENFLVLSSDSKFTPDFLLSLRNLGIRLLSIPNDLVMFPVRTEEFLKIPLLTESGYQGNSVKTLEYLPVVFSKRSLKYLDECSVYQSLYKIHLGTAFLYGPVLLSVTKGDITDHKEYKYQPFRIHKIK